MNYQALELSTYEWFTHYLPVLFPLFISFVSLAIPIFQPGGRDMTAFVLIPIPIAYLLYRIQTKALRFTKATTPQPADKNFSLLRSLALEQEWKPINELPGVKIVLRTKGFPATLSSWGEQVTVLFQDQNIYVNSICDPSKHSSMFAGGRNQENIQRILAVLNATQAPNPPASGRFK